MNMPAPEHIKVNVKKESIEEVLSFPFKGFTGREITRTTTTFFGVRSSTDAAGVIEKHYYPYNEGKSFKVRKVRDKEFYWIGKSGGLFGRHLFSNENKRIVITEGELDALSVAQAMYVKYEKFYPVVSVASATNLGSLIDEREWLRGFGEVIIMFDNDQAGKNATREAIRIIGADKCKIVIYPPDCKDASDVLVKHGPEEVQRLQYNAEVYVPPGIMTKEMLWDALENYNSAVSVPYPDCLAGVNSKTKGMRLGEISLFVSGTGSGKSSLLREIMYHILTNVPDEDGAFTKKVGIVALEESPAETARKLAGLAINKNPSFEEVPIAELKAGFDKVFGEDRAIVIDHQGAVTDSTIIDKLEYLALMGCEYIFLDHITILISEGVDGVTGNEAQDKVMNDLLKLVKRHNIWIGLVSHLRKTLGKGRSYEEGLLPNLDSIRGSGSTKQISMDVIGFARNMKAKSEEKQNTIRMAVLKCRHTGLTGEVFGAIYDHPTGRLIGLDHIPEDDDAESFTEI
jgi:twinkle protein